jgi:hypothetical protein
MFNTFYFIIDTVVKNILTIKQKTSQNATELITKYNLDTRAFEMIVLYAKTATQIKEYMNRLYNSNQNMRLVVDYSVYFSRCVYCMVLNQRIQPFKNDWICTSILIAITPPFSDQYYFNDTYQYNGIESLQESCDTIQSIVNSTDNTLEGMITMKMGDQYINHVFFNRSEANVETELPLVPSKHQFLSIKYSHPKMAQPIFIDIDKEYYYAYNELLSPLFIQRYLEYQPLNYIFDMDYELEVMDNDINTHVLTSKQYILLAESTYVIKNIEQNPK